MTYAHTAETDLLLEADLYIKDSAYRQVIDLDAAFGDEYAHAVIAVAIGLAEDAGYHARTQP